jgi:hypothetical protein
VPGYCRDVHQGSLVFTDQSFLRVSVPPWWMLGLIQ